MVINIESIFNAQKLTFPISEFFIIPIFSGKDDKKVLGFIDLKLTLSLNDNCFNFLKKSINCGV